jgi:hypothetical protein
MNKKTEDLRVSAQQALDELFAERLIPFTLAVRAVESIGLEEYILRFQDHRLSSVDVSWLSGQPFKAAVRSAVLSRVSRLHGAFAQTSAFAARW